MAGLNDDFKWATWRSTRYTETVGGGVPTSPIEELRHDGSRVLRTYFVYWQFRELAAENFLGYPYLEPTTAGRRVLHRLTPHVYPHYKRKADNRPAMYATQIQRVEGYGSPTDLPINSDGTLQTKSSKDVANYLYAKMDVVYSTLPYEILEDSDVKNTDPTYPFPDESLLKRYITKDAQVATDMLQLPNSTFSFVTGVLPPEAVTVFLQKLIPKADLILTHHDVPRAFVSHRWLNPDAPTTAMEDLPGTVNRTTFGGQPPGTLLYLGAWYRPITSQFGDRLYDIQHRFSFFNPGVAAITGDQAGHNHFIKLGTTSYYEITTDGVTNFVNKANGKSFYNFGEFADLFRPA